MYSIIKKSLMIMIMAAMMITPLTADAAEYFETEDPSGGAMMFDLAVVRPVGIVATAIGAVFFVISSPFSALGGNIDTAGEKLVKDPVAYTFKRPLGEFESMRNIRKY